MSIFHFIYTLPKFTHNQAYDQENPYHAKQLKIILSFHSHQFPVPNQTYQSQKVKDRHKELT